MSFDKWTFRTMSYNMSNSESQHDMNCLAQLVEFLDTMEIIHIGEQIRQSLHDENLIQDRKYHLRTYKSCIVGQDLVGWLIKNKHCDKRQTALEGLAILQNYSLFHHVCDDHEIKDQTLFYRFRRDDGTYKEDKDLTLFYKSLELYNGLTARTNNKIRSYQQDGELFRNAFQGSDLVDYLLREGGVYTREEAVLLGRRLLESDTIRHVTDDYHLRDDSRLLYRFTLDFSKKRYLADVFNYVPGARGGKSRSKSEREKTDFQFHSPDSTPRHTPENTRKRLSEPKESPTSCDGSMINQLDRLGHRELGIEDDRLRSLSGDSGNSTDTSETMAEISTTRSVLLRHATAHELESPETPYVKQTIKVWSDPVGFGFVIRGENPTYVQAVDPTGPAAVAGLKVRQYIYSVNGKYVLRGDHKTVGKLIMQSPSHVTLVVMTHKRDAAM